MIKKLFLGLVVLLGTGLFTFADEGMWMINRINAALEKKMQARGLELSANEIYNADADGASISDAIVSIGFYCTGSIISDEGLLITNHHCAYSDVFALSTPEHNYLEEGYWAMTRDKEIPIPGKKVFFLKKVIDVTSEVESLRNKLKAEGKPYGFRRLNYIMEKKYSADTGLDAYLSAMWSGEKYYMALYKVYTDLRLVAAPPISIAAFGGDEDNWEWPQHKGDFAIYRIYTADDGSPADYSENNIPMQVVSKIKISTSGYKPGDYTMVIGYPGRTDRYSSAPEIDYMQRVDLPITNELRKNQMEIIRSWMEKDPEIRLKYSDKFFSLSNIQKMQEGELACFKRFNVIEEKKNIDKELQEWINADSCRKAQWGNLIDSIAAGYSETENIEKYKSYFRETIFRGNSISRTLMRMNNSREGIEKEKKFLNEGFDSFDPRVEHDLMKYAVEQFYRHIDSSFYGPFQKELACRFGNDYDAITEYLWQGSIVESIRMAHRYGCHKQLENDRVWRFFNDLSITTFNKCDGNLKKKTRLFQLRHEYEKALYRMKEDKGIAMYPDANSTMRITFGTISTIEPKDGILCSWHTTSNGILEKHNPSSHDFNISDKEKSMLLAKDWGKWGVKSHKKNAAEMYIDFLTDNDITGGNSGSPVLNARGEMIGLAFDGNKESLASECSYTPDYNKCVCVDIRYILWILDKYAGMENIIKEIGL